MIVGVASRRIASGEEPGRSADWPWRRAGPTGWNGGYGEIGPGRSPKEQAPHLRERRRAGEGEGHAIVLLSNRVLAQNVME